MDTAELSHFSGKYSSGRSLDYEVLCSHKYWLMLNVQCYIVHNWSKNCCHTREKIKRGKWFPMCTCARWKHCKYGTLKFVFLTQKKNRKKGRNTRKFFRGNLYSSLAKREMASISNISRKHITSCKWHDLYTNFKLERKFITPEYSINVSIRIFINRNVNQRY